MMTSLFRLMINARNEGTEKDTILIKGGSVTFVGGLNTGSGSIIIETQQPVKIVDLINGDDANVVFNQTKDVLLAGVENRGKIILFDSIISIADTTNAGTIDVSGGMYAWYGGNNAGTIKASVSSALLDIDENSGRIVVEAGGGRSNRHAGILATPNPSLSLRCTLRPMTLNLCRHRCQTNCCPSILQNQEFFEGIVLHHPKPRRPKGLDVCLRPIQPSFGGMSHRN